MFAVFRAIITLQCIAQKRLRKTEITNYLPIYSQITAGKRKSSLRKLIWVVLCWAANQSHCAKNSQKKSNTVLASSIVNEL